MSLGDLLEQAKGHAQSGRLGEAESLCRQVLEAAPTSGEAYRILGFVAFHAGRRDQAAEFIEQAIRLAPWVPEYYENLGVILNSLGRHAEAQAAAQRAVELDPRNANAAFELGNALQAQSRWEEAVRAYSYVLALLPEHAPARNNLGNALGALGRREEAIAAYRQALAIQPDLVQALYNLGNLARDAGQMAQAEQSLRQALAIRPQYAEAWHNLGNLLQDQQRYQEAIDAYERALAIQPALAEAWHNLGTALQLLGRLQDALAAYQKALAIRPSAAQSANNLGNVLHTLGRPQEAMEAYRRALSLRPTYPEAENNLGIVLKELGRLDQAVEAYRRALAARPDFAEAFCNLGNALHALGWFDEAADACRRALALRPEFAMGWLNLGAALQSSGRLDEAIQSYERALALDPKLSMAESNMGNALQAQGRLDEAVAAYRRALALDPANAVAHSNLLLTEQYRPQSTPESLLASHEDWDRQHAVPLRQRLSLLATPPVRGSAETGTGTPSPLPTERASRNVGEPVPVSGEPYRPLRIGFISADLGLHPVGFFLAWTLEALRNEACETICYSDRGRKDIQTSRLAAATRWCEICGLSDDAVAQQIQADRVDILVDLAGHTFNRLLVFVRHPAPIQMTWMGYVGTTGVAEIDYLLADRFLVPEGAECHYREKVLRLPDGYVCYRAPDDAPPVGLLPASENGHVTFGSFNNLAKVSPHTLETWAEILRRIPQARLVLKYRGFEDDRTRERFARRFTELGIAPERLDLMGWIATQPLAVYHRIDVALDPFPYTGSMTTCDALWMGVPVITLPGETFAARQSLSHLSNVGLTETIARDRTHYIELAVDLATDLGRLAELRAGLRERMAASPLCDAPRFARNFLEVLRRIWHERSSA